MVFSTYSPLSIHALLQPSMGQKRSMNLSELKTVRHLLSLASKKITLVFSSFETDVIFVLLLDFSRVGHFKLVGFLGVFKEVISFFILGLILVFFNKNECYSCLFPKFFIEQPKSVSQLYSSYFHKKAQPKIKT